MSVQNWDRGGCLAGGAAIPLCICSGSLTCTTETAIRPEFPDNDGIAATPGALQAISQVAPLRPASEPPHASQSSVDVMPASTAIIADFIAAEPAECGTAPTANAASAKTQKRRAKTAMNYPYDCTDLESRVLKSRFGEERDISGFVRRCARSSMIGHSGLSSPRQCFTNSCSVPLSACSSSIF